MKVLKEVKLVKRETTDKNFSLKDDVPLGKTYIIDINSIRNERFFNVEKETYHIKEVVDVYDDNLGENFAGVIATEMFDMSAFPYSIS